MDTCYTNLRQDTDKLSLCVCICISICICICICNVPNIDGLLAVPDKLSVCGEAKGGQSHEQKLDNLEPVLIS